MNFEVQGQPTFVSQKHLYLFMMQIAELGFNHVYFI